MPNNFGGFLARKGAKERIYEIVAMNNMWVISLRPPGMDTYFSDIMAANDHLLEKRDELFKEGWKLTNLAAL